MFRHSRIALAAIGLALFGSPAAAQTSNSSAFALDVNQNVTVGQAVTATVDIGPLAATSGNAPPDFNQSNSVVNFNQSAALNGAISKTLTATAGTSTGDVALSSNSTGTATGANATATINNLTFTLGAFLPASLANLINLTATTIQSTSQANSVGGLDASGTTTIQGLTLSGTAFTAIGAPTIDASLFINPAPNTTIFNFAGLMIILNEQIMSGDGITGTGITTNAIRIGFNNFAVGTGFKTGNVIFSQSQAFATIGQAGAVPEPGTWAMMLMGFGAIGLAVRRRRKVAPIAQLA